ncbi:MAG TPA: ABC transporter ATP-binding protein [bacterium]|nr:ABC transporter ATP-binding protein [bacterium]
MEYALEARSVTKTYKMGEVEVRAVDGASLAVPRGGFVSLMGPSGSGKTTLLNLLGCVDRPSGGDIFIDGSPVSRMSDAELDRTRLLRIGFVFQRVNLIPILTALENVELPMEMAGMGGAERTRRALELLDSVGLSNRAGHKPSQLSAGEQQRVGIARAMANRPSVILADEPTGNLDSASAASVMSLLAELNRQSAQTLVIVTHDPEVGNAAQNKVVIRDGKIYSAERTPGAVD